MSCKISLSVIQSKGGSPVAQPCISRKKINLPLVTQSGTVGHLEYRIFQEGRIIRPSALTFYVFFKFESLASFDPTDID